MRIFIVAQIVGGAGLVSIEGVFINLKNAEYIYQNIDNDAKIIFQTKINDIEEMNLESLHTKAPKITRDNGLLSQYNRCDRGTKNLQGQGPADHIDI